MSEQNGQESDKRVTVGVVLHNLMKPECLRPYYKCDPGFELEILSMVATLLQLKLDLKLTTEPSCGYRMENGSWAGLLGMLERQEIDLIGNLCLLTESRSKIPWLQASWPVVHYKQNFLIKAPEAKYGFSFMGPYEYRAWLAAFLTTLLFTFIFACFYKFKYGQSIGLALRNSTNDICNTIFGTNVQPVNKVAYFLFTSFFGLACLGYSVFITVAIVKPVAIQRPFKDHKDLAILLNDGRYKVLDFNKMPHIKCYDKDVCSLISQALIKHGLHYFNNSHIDNASNLLLNELLTNPNLVLIKNSYQIRNWLHEFPGRSKLWLLQDDNAGEEVWVYFFRKNFPHRKFFDTALANMGSGIDNINSLYYGMSYHVVSTDIIKGTIPVHITFNMNVMNQIMLFYGCLILALSCFSFVVENIVYHCRTTKFTI